MTGSYNLWLVALSFTIALIGSYTALDLVGRIGKRRRASTWPWLVGGAIALGAGIWAMHFIGMLAFRLPIPVAFDTGLTLLSMVIAVLASGAAIWIMSRREAMQRARLTVAATLIGVGIAAMHYTGMLAMRMNPPITYAPSLFVASVLIAILATMVALSLPFWLAAAKTRWVVVSKLGSAVVMAIAICGMHYTGMAAAEFAPGAVCTVAGARDIIDGDVVAVAVGFTTLMLLLVTLIISTIDSHANVALTDVNEKLASVAMYDALTGLPNRLLLADRFVQATHRATRAKARAAVMFIDLDRFKPVNDTLGHRVGDRLLHDVARRLSVSVRAEDTVARIGGDEFVVVLAGIPDAQTAAAVGRKLVAEIQRPYDIDGHAVDISASIGVALFPDDGDQFETLMEKADRAMYGVKRGGRNGVGLFHAESVQA